MVADRFLPCAIFQLAVRLTTGSPDEVGVALVVALSEWPSKGRSLWTRHGPQKAANSPLDSLDTNPVAPLVLLKSLRGVLREFLGLSRERLGRTPDCRSGYLLPDAMVVNAATFVSSREVVDHHERITSRISPPAKNLNDIGGDAVAERRCVAVLVHAALKKRALHR